MAEDTYSLSFAHVFFDGSSSTGLKQINNRSRLLLEQLEAQVNKILFTAGTQVALTEVAVCLYPSNWIGCFGMGKMFFLCAFCSGQTLYLI